MAELTTVRQYFGNLVITPLIVSVNQFKAAKMRVDEFPQFVVYTRGPIKREGRPYAREDLVFM